ncbi:hypothetical protein EG347_19530 [Chryseobacterium sp. G0186]|nr:hypothetical protein EG347_19530 [Chryseobacterium sp. G0186]
MKSRSNCTSAFFCIGNLSLNLRKFNLKRGCISLLSVKKGLLFKNENNVKCFIGSSYEGVYKSSIVELLQKVVELLQFFRFMFKSFFYQKRASIFATQSLNHKILLTIKIYKSWQKEIREES